MTPTELRTQYYLTSSYKVRVTTDRGRTLTDEYRCFGISQALEHAKRAAESVGIDLQHDRLTIFVRRSP